MGRHKGYGVQVKTERPDIRKMMKYTAKIVVIIYFPIITEDIIKKTRLPYRKPLSLL